MRTLAALAAITLASHAQADVLYETSIQFVATAGFDPTRQYDDTIVFNWTMVDPIGSFNPANRFPVLSLAIDNASPVDLAASATAGTGFDLAAAALTDDTIEISPFFFVMRTDFLLPDGTVGTNSDTRISEAEFLASGSGNPPSLAGAQIDELRVELISATIDVSSPATNSATAIYELNVQILGVIPTPATAAPLAAAALLTTRRRR